MGALEAVNLSFSYPDEDILIIDNFSHTFSETGITGLLGPNGIGKSTLMALLAGSFKPNTGEVLINGRPTSEFTSEKEINDSVTFVFQNMEFEIEETIETVMEMVAGTNPQKDHESPAELRAAFGIDHLAKTSIQKISKGELQKVILCLSLLSPAHILLLDEPVFALSYEDATKALTTLHGFTEKRKMLVVLSLHDIGQMERFCDHVILFHKDRSYEAGSAKTILTPEKLEQVYGTPYSLLKLPKSLSNTVENMERMEEMERKRDGLKNK